MSLVLQQIIRKGTREACKRFHVLVLLLTANTSGFHFFHRVPLNRFFESSVRQNPIKTVYVFVHKSREKVVHFPTYFHFAKSPMCLEKIGIFLNIRLFFPICHISHWTFYRQSTCATIEGYFLYHLCLLYLLCHFHVFGSSDNQINSQELLCWLPFYISTMPEGFIVQGHYE